MAFTLDRVVPWGRSFEEYLRMFDLGADELAGRVLGCGDGPAGFNAKLAARGGRVVSADPLYVFSAAEIRGRIDATLPEVIAQTRANREAYVWEEIPTIEELERRRRGAMETFLEDYEEGREAGRYLAHALPDLPFEEGAFDLALSSHFLFLYSEQLSAEFHARAAAEMLRVAREARIFPLLDLAGRPSPHVEPVRRELELRGFRCEIRTVPYEFQRGGNRMLRAWRA